MRMNLHALRLLHPLLLLINCIFALSNAQTVVIGGKTTLTNPCLEQNTCGGCITASAACMWCTASNFTESRCDFQNNLLRHGCPETAMQNPASSTQQIKDDQLSERSMLTGQEVPIQLRPQRVSVRLRPHNSQTLKLQYKQAMDYPVDLYYLMDLSKSMEDDKDKLSELGMILSEEMQKITSNFRLGFGSFVDKVVMPYVSTVPEKLKAPCLDCAAPYGFINHMSLGTDAGLFARRVNETRISGNLDAPEGGFDAIMQSIVCERQIGWRNHSRRLLLFSTDSGFHYAGDGKLGGIIKPNDGQCHLNPHGKYTESETQDYPSISQINAKVKEHAVNVIFAVTANQFRIYKQLVPLVEGSSAGQLMNDSSNVVELVKQEYDKITSSVQLKHDMRKSLNDYIRIKYYSKCVNSRQAVETDTCSGLRVNTQVAFDVKLELLKCPPDPSDWKQTIRIRTVGLQDELIIDLEMLCDCDCARNPQLHSPACHGNGAYACGICTCDSNHYGRNCECDAKEANISLEEERCRRHPNETRVCSGHGVCRCGSCECGHKFADGQSIGRYSGDFCECDNWDCPRKDGLLCSGPEHGHCECGHCVCNPAYTGEDCSCPSSNDSCIKKGDTEECSGRGTCECGVCKCNNNNSNYYSGTWCEDCPSCPTECQLLRDCVRCQVFGTGPISQDLCLNASTTYETNQTDCNFLAIQTEQLEVDEQKGETLCEFIDDEDNCRVKFKYSGNRELNTVVVTVLRHKDCPKKVNILAIVIGVIVGIVLVGLVLLMIWKLLTTIQDRREFARFEKERQMAKWDTGENPIFKQATTTFKNPTYGGKH